MTAPAPTAPFRATRFLGGGTFGRVYIAEQTEDPITAVRDGCVSSLIMKEGYIATDHDIEKDPVLGKIQRQKPSPSSIKKGERQTAAEIKPAAWMNGPVSRSREAAVMACLPQFVDPLTDIAVDEKTGEVTIAGLSPSSLSSSFSAGQSSLDRSSSSADSADVSTLSLGLPIIPRSFGAFYGMDRPANDNNINSSTGAGHEEDDADDEGGQDDAAPSIIKLFTFGERFGQDLLAWVDSTSVVPSSGAAGEAAPTALANTERCRRDPLLLREITRQVIRCFAVLHHCYCCAHRDIKPHNILVLLQPLPQPELGQVFPLVRLCDMGSVRAVRPVCDANTVPGAYHRKQPQKQTEWHMVLKRKAEDAAAVDRVRQWVEARRKLVDEEAKEEKQRRAILLHLQQQKARRRKRAQEERVYFGSAAIDAESDEEDEGEDEEAFAELAERAGIPVVPSSVTRIKEQSRLFARDACDNDAQRLNAVMRLNDGGIGDITSDGVNHDDEEVEVDSDDDLLENSPHRSFPGVRFHSDGNRTGGPSFSDLAKLLPAELSSSALKEHATSFITARYYRDPCLLAGSTQYGTATDMWSIGVSLAEIFMLAASSTDPEVSKTLSKQRWDGSSSDEQAKLHALKDEAIAEIEREMELKYGNGNGGATANSGNANGNNAFHQQQVQLYQQRMADRKARIHNRLAKIEADWERRKRHFATIFHGATNDGLQLLHIINLLGTPSELEISGMRLQPACEVAFRCLLQQVIRRAYPELQRDVDWTGGTGAPTAMVKADGNSAADLSGDKAIASFLAREYGLSSSSSSSSSDLLTSVMGLGSPLLDDILPAALAHAGYKTHRDDARAAAWPYNVGYSASRVFEEIRRIRRHQLDKQEKMRQKRQRLETAETNENGEEQEDDYKDDDEAEDDDEQRGHSPRRLAIEIVEPKSTLPGQLAGGRNGQVIESLRLPIPKDFEPQLRRAIKSKLSQLHRLAKKQRRTISAGGFVVADQKDGNEASPAVGTRKKRASSVAAEQTSPTIVSTGIGGGGGLKAILMKMIGSNNQSHASAIAGKEEDDSDSDSSDKHDVEDDAMSFASDVTFDCDLFYQDDLGEDSDAEEEEEGDGGAGSLEGYGVVGLAPVVKVMRAYTSGAALKHADDGNVSVGAVIQTRGLYTRDGISDFRRMRRLAAQDISFVMTQEEARLYREEAARQVKEDEGVTKRALEAARNAALAVLVDANQHASPSPSCIANAITAASKASSAVVKAAVEDAYKRCLPSSSLATGKPVVVAGVTSLDSALPKVTLPPLLPKKREESELEQEGQEGQEGRPLRAELSPLQRTPELFKRADDDEEENEEDKEEDDDKGEHCDGVVKFVVAEQDESQPTSPKASKLNKTKGIFASCRSLLLGGGRSNSNGHLAGRRGSGSLTSRASAAATAMAMSTDLSFSDRILSLKAAVAALREKRRLAFASSLRDKRPEDDIGENRALATFYRPATAEAGVDEVRSLADASNIAGSSSSFGLSGGAAAQLSSHSRLLTSLLMSRPSSNDSSFDGNEQGGGYVLATAMATIAAAVSSFSSSKASGSGSVAGSTTASATNGGNHSMAAAGSIATLGGGNSNSNSNSNSSAASSSSSVLTADLFGGGAASSGGINSVAASSARCNGEQHSHSHPHAGYYSDASTSATTALPPPPFIPSLLDTHQVASVDMVAFLCKRGVPSDMADLIARMLKWDPRQRITAEEALRHPALSLYPSYRSVFTAASSAAAGGGGTDNSRAPSERANGNSTAVNASSARLAAAKTSAAGANTTTTNTVTTASLGAFAQQQLARQQQQQQQHLLNSLMGGGGGTAAGRLPSRPKTRAAAFTGGGIGDNDDDSAMLLDGEGVGEDDNEADNEGGAQSLLDQSFSDQDLIHRHHQQEQHHHQPHRQALLLRQHSSSGSATSNSGSSLQSYLALQPPSASPPPPPLPAPASVLAAHFLPAPKAVAAVNPFAEMRTGGGNGAAGGKGEGVGAGRR